MLQESQIKTILSSLLSASNDAGSVEKKKTVPGTYHCGSISGNRLNSGTIRSQIIVCDKQEWNRSPAIKAIHSDQRVFVQVGHDVWDIYKGGSQNTEDTLPVLIAQNQQNLAQLLKNQIQLLQTVPVVNNPTTTGTSTVSTPITGAELSYLTALRTKPFMLLAGISGTGKSRIVRKMAQASITEELQKKYDPNSVANGFDRWALHKPANFELIQVKPNWHNSTEVIGYKSNLNGTHYEFTPFVEFVAKAWKHQDIPFFLCLDEMNLAPVEQYFAEFLSAIESRSSENGEYETDPIIKPFKDFEDNLCNQMLNHLIGVVDASKVVPGSNESKLVERFKYKGLTLPQNLLILGTVNMDETTFTFSRKVLDRAMSIVMNDVDYENFFEGKTEDDIQEMSDAVKNLLIDRPIRGLKASNNEISDVQDYLTDINKILDNTPFKLGYRAANEALLYASAAHCFDPQVTIESILDDFTMMKILSRIEGDKRSIEDLLIQLQAVITNKYPKSYTKLNSLINALKTKQFVSYWN